MATNDDVTDWCVATTKKRNGSMFNIIGNADGSYQIHVYVEGARWKGSYSSFSFQVDSKTLWTAPDANYYSSSIFVKNLKKPVILQLAYGNEVHLGNWKGEYVETYSLAGSKAAILAMLDCQSKLTSRTASY